jgi:hypothetical protein
MEMNTELHSSFLQRYMSVPVRAIVQGVLVLFGAAATIIAIAGDLADGGNVLQDWLVESVDRMAVVLHLVLIVLVLFPGRMRYLNPDVDDERVQAILEVLNLFFLRAWTYLWVCLGIYYAIRLFDNVDPIRDRAVAWHTGHITVKIWLRGIADVADLLGTFFLLLCYSFLKPAFLRRYVGRLKDAHTRERKAGSSGALFKAKYKARRWFHYYEFVLPLVIFTLLLTGLYIVHANLLLLFHYTAQVEYMTTTFLGLVSATVLGLFAGLLDGRFVLKWQWMIVVLFLYACAQSMGAMEYTDDKLEKAAFVYALFTMKCLFFMFISDFYESHRIVHYAHEVVRTQDIGL